MIGVIIQARTGSTRYPNKIYEDLNGKCTLQRVLEGVLDAKLPNRIILAMPEYDRSSLTKQGKILPGDNDRFKTYFGHPDDLVDRYFQAARLYDIDLVVRVTADCPLIQGKIIDEMLCEYLKNGYNGFMGNNQLVSSVPYPDGTDIEIFPYWMLAETYQLTNDPIHREHVSPFMYRRGTEYNIHQFLNCRPNTIISTKFKDFSFDTAQDYRLLLALTEEYDKHGSLNKAIKDVHFQIRTCRVND